LRLNSRVNSRGQPGKRIAWPQTLAAMRQDALRA
jgi:hypothetical protein